METRSQFEIGATDFTNLVRDRLCFEDYDFSKSEQMGPGESMVFKNITNKFDMFDIGDFERWKKGVPIRHGTATLLSRMCADGDLEPGDYIITIDK